MSNKSVTLAACKALGHQKVAHSPNSFDIIEECPECCMAWMIKPSGEEIRLRGSYELRLIQQKGERAMRDAVANRPKGDS